MKAVVLVGGLGTRLRPYTFCIPKPLLPFGEKPILQVIIEQLKRHGIDEVILATGYQAELIHAFCGDGSKFGVEVSYVHEHQALGTAGPLGLIRDRIDPDELFILMNGDIVTDLDFAALAAFAERRDFDVTVAYTRLVYQSPYGVLRIADDEVRGIEEKPTTHYSISAGIYAIRGRAIARVPSETYDTMPQLIERLVASGRPIGAYLIDGFWIGLESVAHFDEALKRLNGDVEEVTRATAG